MISAERKSVKRRRGSAWSLALSVGASALMAGGVLAAGSLMPEPASQSRDIIFSNTQDCANNGGAFPDYILRKNSKLPFTPEGVTVFIPSINEDIFFESSAFPDSLALDLRRYGAAAYRGETIMVEVFKGEARLVTTAHHREENMLYRDRVRRCPAQR